MQTRTPGHIMVYDDGVAIYLGIIKGDDAVELEISSIAAERLIEELMSRITFLRKTVDMAG